MKSIEKNDLADQNVHEKVVRYQTLQQEKKLHENYQNIDINEIRKYFRNYEITILMKKIYDLFPAKFEQTKNFTQEWKDLEKNLEYLLKENPKESQLRLKIISLIKQFSKKQFNETQVILEVEKWQSLRLHPLQILQIFEEYNLNNLIQISEIKNIVAQIIYNHKNLSKYEFYNKLLLLLIQQEMNKGLKQQISETQCEENIIESLELKAISFIVNQDKQINESLLNQQQFQIESLLNLKHIIDFLIARHFDRYLSMISEDQTNDLRSEIHIFIAIRNKSNIGQLNFQLEEFTGAINYLKEKYQFRESSQKQLIKMIQASALVSNFEQEAGNAMTMLSHIQAIIRNQDFSNINLKNCSMNNIQFFESNFNESKLLNVNIATAQFIECQLQFVSWKNLESSSLNIFNESKNSIFSSHQQVLIQCTYENTIIFQNLQTDKKVKFFCKQCPTYYYIKQSLKLSCQGQILAFNDRKRTIFWSIQCNKKIRTNIRKTFHSKNQLSPNGEVLACVSLCEIILWKIYNKKQNINLAYPQVQSTFFSKNSKVFIMILWTNRKILFQNIFDGEELRIISSQKLPAFQLLYKFSPDCSHYALYESQQLSIICSKVRNDITVLNKKFENINYLKFSPDGQFIAFSNQTQIFLWQINNEKQFQSFNTFYHIHSQKIKFSLDGEFLIFKNNKNVIIQQIKQGLRFYILQGHQAEIEDLSLSINGLRLVTSDGKGNSTRLWNIGISTNWQTQQYNPSLNIPETLIISPCGLLIGFVNDNKIIEIKNLKDLRTINRIEFDQVAVKLVILSQDCKIFAYSNSGNSICFQRIEDRKTVMQQKFDQKIQQIKFSPNGQYLVVVTFLSAKYVQQIQNQQKPTSNCNLQVFRIEDWKEIKIVREFGKGQQFEFSQNSQEIALCSFCSIKILNLISQQKDKILIEEEFKNIKNGDKNDQSKSVAFSQNGKYLASDCQNNSIRIWKIDDQKVIQRLIGHEGKINKIAFLNDEMILVSASSDCTIRIWNTQNEQQIQQIKLHQSDIFNLAFSFDKKLMVSTDQKGKIILWKVQLNNLTQNEIKYHFTPYYALGNPTFSALQCQSNGSQFSSFEGYNLLSLFTYKQ